MNTEITYTCLNCNYQFEIDVTEGSPGCTYGPPEDCYPATDPEIDVEACPECEAEVDYESCLETATDLARSFEEGEADMRMDEQRGN